MPPLTNFSGTFFAAAALIRSDVAIINHLREHAIARLDGAVHVPFRSRVVIRRADDAAEKRSLAEREVANVFPEVRFSSFAEPAD